MPAPYSFKEKEMKVLNSGSIVIKYISGGRAVELKKGETVEMDEKTFSVLNKFFRGLEKVEEKSVIIESKPEKIEKKTEKKTTVKKSKAKK